MNSPFPKWISLAVVVICLVSLSGCGETDHSAACEKLASPGLVNTKVSVDFDKIDTVAAIDACSNAVKKNEHDKQSWFYLGRALDKSGDGAAAEAAYSKSVALGNTVALSNLGTMYAVGKSVQRSEDKATAYFTEYVKAGSPFRRRPENAMEHLLKVLPSNDVSASTSENADCPLNKDLAIWITKADLQSPVDLRYKFFENEIIHRKMQSDGDTISCRVVLEDPSIAEAEKCVFNASLKIDEFLDLYPEKAKDKPVVETLNGLRELGPMFSLGSVVSEISPVIRFNRAKGELTVIRYSNAFISREPDEVFSLYQKARGFVSKLKPCDLATMSHEELSKAFE